MHAEITGGNLRVHLFAEFDILKRSTKVVYFLTQKASGMKYVRDRPCGQERGKDEKES